MSFQTGLSGLNAASRNLDVIGNNIANANTVGMKASRAEFADLVSASLGAGGGKRDGIGVSVAAVSQQFSQGNINITGNALDLAINGGGFFELTMPDGTTAYTRDGAFKLDKIGNIVTNAGALVKGYPTDPTGVASSTTPAPLQLPTTAPIGAKQTTKLAAEFNLNANAKIWNSAPPPDTPLTKYGTSLTVYDSQGVAIPTSLYLRKTDFDQWDVYTDPNDPDNTLITTLNFDPNGKVLSGAESTLTIRQPNNPNIVDFPVTVDLSKVTQYGAAFAVSNLTQDGYAPGELTSIAIGKTGVVMATYSNGQSLASGQLALADFRNVQGLSPIGGNNWVESFASGQPVHGAPGTSKFGALSAGALEESNVDLTSELVNMMTAQRAYQANAQTIKTQDQVLSTLVNLR